MNNQRLTIWKHETKDLMKQMTYIKLLSVFEECLVELSDEQWEKKVWLKDDIITKEIKVPKARGFERKLIDEKLNIIQVAKIYGISIDNDKIQCPYHEDNEPSCKLYPTTNSFFCFGCRKAGDIFEFIRKLEEIKNGNKR